MFNYKEYPNKINLGCGFDKRNGFLNVDLNDFHEPDLVCNIENLQELPTSYYEYALANDILEHIPRLKTRNVLKEWNRILQLGAILELQVPNVEGVLSLLQKKKFKTPEKQENLLRCLFGTQAYPGDFHYTGFTEIVLRKMLSDTGFNVKELQTIDGWLFHVIAEKTANNFADDIFFLSDEEFIKTIYERYLNRPADEGGFNYYLGLLQQGIAKEAIIDTIKISDEYVNIK